MGRNLKIRGILNWFSRDYIYRRAAPQRSIERILDEWISNINPNQRGISKIEYHYLSNGKLKVIISGINTCIKNLKNFQDYFFYISERRGVNEPSIEFILQELPYNYLSPILLAKSIAGRLQFTPGLNEINYWLENEMKRIQESRKKNIGINGIRIEIKGITGKMTMSKKIIKTYGTLKFNSSDSIIDVGYARNLNIRGILGVKIWISYSEYKCLTTTMKM